MIYTAGRVPGLWVSARADGVFYTTDYSGLIADNSPIGRSSRLVVDGVPGVIADVNVQLEVAGGKTEACMRL